MIQSWHYGVLMAASYLIGGIPFGLIVARVKGVDLRAWGSGNVGATNVGRALGRKWGVLVLLLDASKGAACTFTAGFLTSRDATMTGTMRDYVWLGTAAACVIGSIAPVYLRFKGGKGVAASLGAVLGIYPYLTYSGLIDLLLWTVVVKATRYISLGSIVAAICLPIVFVSLSVVMKWGLSEHVPLLGLCLTLAAMVLIRHRDNIRRLLTGTENKVGQPRV
ncbi:MAG: glycerol-3-phosphate 1-O-acyltransferase PlsY [Planctomycetota bacterium]